MHYLKGILVLLVISLPAFGQKKTTKATNTTPAGDSRPWSREKANAWYAQQPWIIGADYIPATAINQLEMWQAETFDTTTINKELGWAEQIGFNTMRVYLHSLAYKQDPEGFKRRMDKFLEIADRHKIRALFVFFDDVWDKSPRIGKQREPKPGIHNSGWMQDPGDPYYKDTTLYPALRTYVTDVLNTFGKDKRILLWDLYNEPGNSGKRDTSLLLLTRVFQWAWAANPDQPLSVGLWAWDLTNLNAYQALNSDIITYHDYEDAAWHQRVIELLKSHGKPLICTEYMARTRNSRFSTVLPLLKRENVGAINWGFVAGKTNTIYAWDTPIPGGEEPIEWFHDIFRPDGTPYRRDEVDLIKKLSSQK